MPGGLNNSVILQTQSLLPPGAPNFTAGLNRSTLGMVGLIADPPKFFLSSTEPKNSPSMLSHHRQSSVLHFEKDSEIGEYGTVQLQP